MEKVRDSSRTLEKVKKVEKVEKVGGWRKFEKGSEGRFVAPGRNEAARDA